MKTRLIAFFTLSLACSLALAQEACEQISATPRTVRQMADAQLSGSKNAFITFDSDSEPNKCFPRAKSVMIGGMPLCQLNFMNVFVPVVAAVFGSTEDSSNAETSMYVMRGQKDDVAAASAYFDKSYSDATDEYLKDIKKQRVFGSLRAWKKGAQYIVLEQDEPGYRTEDMSLSLIIGSKKGLIMLNTDLNSCR